MPVFPSHRVTHVLEHPQIKLAEQRNGGLHESVLLFGEMDERGHEHLGKETQKLVVDTAVLRCSALLQHFYAKGVQFLPEHKSLVVHEQVLQTCRNMPAQDKLRGRDRQLAQQCLRSCIDFVLVLLDEPCLGYLLGVQGGCLPDITYIQYLLRCTLGSRMISIRLVNKL